MQNNGEYSQKYFSQFVLDHHAVMRRAPSDTLKGRASSLTNLPQFPISKYQRVWSQKQQWEITTPPHHSAVSARGEQKRRKYSKTLDRMIWTMAPPKRMLNVSLHPTESGDCRIIFWNWCGSGERGLLTPAHASVLFEWLSGIQCILQIRRMMNGDVYN